MMCVDPGKLRISQVLDRYIRSWYASQRTMQQPVQQQGSRTKHLPSFFLAAPLSHTRTEDVMVSVRSKKSRSIVISTVARTAIKGAFALFLAGLVVLTVVLLSCSHAMSQDYALMIDPDFLTITAEMRIEASSSPSVDSLPRSSQERSPPKKKKKNGRHQHEFIITFVGDTMLQNTGYNWETAHHGNYWNPADGFQYLKPLLNRTDYLIMNLEGPITTLPITGK